MSKTPRLDKATRPELLAVVAQWEDEAESTLLGSVEAARKIAKTSLEVAMEINTKLDHMDWEKSYTTVPINRAVVGAIVLGAIAGGAIGAVIGVAL